MNPTHRNWDATLWHRHARAAFVSLENRDPEDVEPDDLEPREVLQDGVQIRDFAYGMTYLVTIGRANGRVWLRSLEIEPHRDNARIDNAALRRIPVQVLAEYAALYLDDRDRVRKAIGTGAPRPTTGTQAFGIRAPRGSIRMPGEQAVPTSAEVAALLKEGHTRKTLAAMFYRTPSTISDWIGRAYREVPDQMPPRRPGGRRPANTPKPNTPHPHDKKDTT
jgi:hypothetical protein